jgi:hypothetical protein
MATKPKAPGALESVVEASPAPGSDEHDLHIKSDKTTVSLSFKVRASDDRDAFLRSAESWASMMRSMAALGSALASAAPEASPQLARSVQARENFYERISKEHGLLTSEEAGRRMGSRSKRPANAAIQAREDGRLVALRRGRYVLFPGFQFEDSGQPRQVIAELRRKADEHGLDETDLVEWLCLPSNHLEGSTPADVLGAAPDLALRAADDLFGIEW